MQLWGLGRQYKGQRCLLHPQALSTYEGKTEYLSNCYKMHQPEPVVYPAFCWMSDPWGCRIHTWRSAPCYHSEHLPRVWALNLSALCSVQALSDILPKPTVKGSYIIRVHLAKHLSNHTMAGGANNIIWKGPGVHFTTCWSCHLILDINFWHFVCVTYWNNTELPNFQLYK